MSPHWTERVVALHPIFVTGIFVALFAGAALLIPSVLDRATYGPLPLFACLTLWNFCLHRVAIHKIAARTGTHAQTPRIIFVLIACQVAFTAVLLATRYIANEQLLGLAETLLLASLIGAGISYFGLMFSAAAALMKFEEGTRPVPIHKMIGTVLLLVYLPLGIWLLHGRVDAMLRKRAAMATAP